MLDTRLQPSSLAVWYPCIWGILWAVEDSSSQFSREIVNVSRFLSSMRNFVEQPRQVLYDRTRGKDAASNVKTHRLLTLLERGSQLIGNLSNVDMIMGDFVTIRVFFVQLCAPRWGSTAALSHTTSINERAIGSFLKRDVWHCARVIRNVPVRTDNKASYIRMIEWPEVSD